MHPLGACTPVLLSLVVSSACPTQGDRGTLCGEASPFTLITRKPMDMVEEVVEISESLMKGSARGQKTKRVAD